MAETGCNFLSPHEIRKQLTAAIEENEQTCDILKELTKRLKNTMQNLKNYTLCINDKGSMKLHFVFQIYPLLNEDNTCEIGDRDTNMNIGHILAQKLFHDGWEVTIKFSSNKKIVRLKCLEMS